jgi:peptide/nickel transport system substrate-binding protein
MDRRRSVMGTGRRAVVVFAALGSFLAVSLAGTALAQSVSSSAAPAGSGEPITFIEGTTGDLNTVNPWKALTSQEYEIIGMNFDMLENFDKANLTAVPGLASSWTQSQDALTWTFTIRDDVKWQDGQPLTADDLAFTYNTTLDCQLGNSLDYLVPSFTKSVAATSPTTLVWTMNTPNTAPIRPPWVYIVPQHIWEGKDCADIKKDPFFDDGKMIGSGPFQMTDWVKGESWTMTANKDYWAGAPQIDRFVVRHYNNPEAMVSALKTGEIDYTATATPSLFQSIASENGANGLTAWVGPVNGYDQLSFNMCDPAAADAAPYCKKTGGTGNPILRDVTVRKAIEMAIDEQTLSNKVLLGYASPGSTVVVWPEFHVEPTNPVQFSIDGANQMLDQAGYVDTDGDGTRNDKGGGQNLEFRFIIRSDSDYGAQLGQYISGWLKQIGIKTDITAETTNKLTNDWYDNDYDMYIWGWYPDPDPDFILSTFTSGQCGSWSDTCYSNPEYDKLYKDQQIAKSQEDRAAIIGQMQQIIYDDAPEIVLMYDKYLEIYNSAKWAGLEDNQQPQPVGLLWNQYTPYSALTLHLRGNEPASTSSGGIPAIAWVGIIAVVGIVIAGVIGVSRRRSASDEDMA